MNTITLDLLTDLGACEPQFDRFRELFGAQVEPTLELCLAHASEFDWMWAARHLLTENSYWTVDAARNKASDVYIWETGPADQIRTKSEQTVYDAYRRTNRGTADWTEYDNLLKRIRTEYETATAPALKTYHETVATAWYQGWAADQKETASC